MASQLTDQFPEISAAQVAKTLAQEVRQYREKRLDVRCQSCQPPDDLRGFRGSEAEEHCPQLFHPWRFGLLLQIADGMRQHSYVGVESCAAGRARLIQRALGRLLGPELFQHLGEGGPDRMPREVVAR